MKHLESKIAGTIEADEIIIGKGVVVEEDVLITSRDGSAKKVILGDFCFIGRHTRIIVPEFSIGDYSKINAFSFAHGYKPLHIGRNCWTGGQIVLDSIGGLDIDDNVCIGANSHVWTHMQFGDLVEGCRFFSQKYLYIPKDVWIGGHCTVTPVEIEERSMLLAGSVITKPMRRNRIYAGVPAVDVSDKLGEQFENRTVEQKAEKLQGIIDDFLMNNPQHKGKLKVVQSPDDIERGVCCFDVSRRVYTKTYSEAEVTFLKSNTPLIKFTPDNEEPFIVPLKSNRDI